MKKLSDLTPYTNILPYASEIFGVYQPILGWRSKRIKAEIERGFANDIQKLSDAILANLNPKYQIRFDPRGEKVDYLRPAAPVARPFSPQSFVYDAITKKLPPVSEYKETIWGNLIKTEEIQRALTGIVIPKCLQWYNTASKAAPASAVTTLSGTAATRSPDPIQAVAAQLHRESVLAGYLLQLRKAKQFDKLKALFYGDNTFSAKFAMLTALYEYKNPLDYIDPYKDLDRVSLSPLGIVHLFRQYFYEFDTFLSTPVGHVWLSPGSTVELIEVSSRKTITEKVLETALETAAKAETSETERDEISDAVKENNRSDVKFGFNTKVHQGWVGGHADASASIDINNTQEKAREVSHKHMREQSEKLSTEIRKNFKSTFRTVSETTDTSSKRYVLTNSTDKLINYELRRKMRQVGVQVQDIGTYLSWQTYVDNPGKELGIAKLVHLAKSPELDSIPDPISIPVPEPITTTKEISIPFVAKGPETNEDDMDEVYRNGVEVYQDTFEGPPEKIKYKFKDIEAFCDQSGYIYYHMEWDYRGNDIEVEVYDLDTNTEGKVTFSIRLKHVNFRNVSPLTIGAKITWVPTDTIKAEIDAKNKASLDKTTEKVRYEHEKAYVEAARERIEQASGIQPRKFEDLREEERIVVYRRLIRMLTKGIPQPDDRTHHVVAELLNTIFDIDKMLYFVAPEWWRPRFYSAHQNLGLQKPPETTPGPTSGDTTSIYKEIVIPIQVMIPMAPNVEDTQIASSSVVGWGGLGENRANNYYITDKSESAKLGASLGWLLQLDGDNLRNAFLNAPWVKAVIPIRPGKERAAMNWLSRVNVEGTEGLDDDYVAPPSELAGIPHSGPKPTVKDAIFHLCDQVAEKHKASMTVGKYPPEEINDDNKVSATPIDKVYEHGFYPLKGGFKVKPGTDPFDIFDQWIEILPTDQVVPVEVQYDPKTGRQL
ncbi:MAG: peptidoglycan-binding protein [Candidatus Rokubacteria bacterium]|nr:peptidoglycan-binding protein [Candidatus Rokubacteria bacterium]